MQIVRAIRGNAEQKKKRNRLSYVRVIGEAEKGYSMVFLRTMTLNIINETEVDIFWFGEMEHTLVIYTAKVFLLSVFCSRFNAIYSC